MNNIIEFPQSSTDRRRARIRLAKLALRHSQRVSYRDLPRFIGRAPANDPNGDGPRAA